VSDDRFEDLGADRRAEIGDQLAERDRSHPEARRPEVPRPGNKYAWAVGIVMLMILGVVFFTQTLPNSGEALQGPAPGDPMTDFAAPDALGNVEGDANVCQAEPCNPNAGKVPACDVRGDDVVTVCARDRGPLVLTFVVTRGTDCEPQVDRVERVRREVPGVRFVTVLSGDDREEARGLAEARGWEQPVAVDEDGQVVNAYGVGVCPLTVFARDGVVRRTVIGNLTEAQLRARAQRLLR
jgi:peroxiredoxin